MTTSAYYRAQAERCRRLAGEIHSQEAAERLLKVAEEYERQAADLESKPPDGLGHWPRQ
jgi:hypothetical protein